MKKRLIPAFLLLLVFMACEKDTPETPVGLTSKITINNESATDIGYYSARITGTLGDTYGHTVKEYGHCWDTIQNPEITANMVSFGSTNTEKSFTSELDDLKPGKKYYA